MNVDSVIKLLGAIAKLIEVLIWPGIILFVLVKYSSAIGDFFARLVEFTFKGAGIETSLRTTDNLHTLEREIQEQIQSKLSSQEVIEKLQNSDKDDMKNQLISVADDITKDIHESSFVSVDVSNITGIEGDVFEWPLSAFDHFSQLADKVYFKLQGKVRPYTYGETWILQDKNSKNIIQSIGMIKGVVPGRKITDSRTLAQARISGGQELEAIFWRSRT